MTVDPLKKSSKHCPHPWENFEILAWDNLKPSAWAARWLLWLLSTEMWDINQSEGRLLDSAFPRKKRGNCRDDGSKPVALILMKISHCSWTLHDKFSQLWLCWWSIDGVRFQTESPVSAKAFSTAGGQAARSRNAKVWPLSHFPHSYIFVTSIHWQTDSVRNLTVSLQFRQLIARKRGKKQCRILGTPGTSRTAVVLAFVRSLATSFTLPIWTDLNDLVIVPSHFTVQLGYMAVKSESKQFLLLFIIYRNVSVIF